MMKDKKKRLAGVGVLFTTRSGGNAFHGAAVWDVHFWVRPRTPSCNSTATHRSVNWAEREEIGRSK
jgi:hypothetical protein